MSISTRGRLGAFGAAQTVLFLPLAALDRRMMRTGGPGIIPFELAGTTEHSRKILDTWGEEGRSAARRSLLLDYPFLVAYSGFNLACSAAASDALRSNGASALARAGRSVGAMQVAAGACDAAENTALLGVLAGHDERLPGMARAFASAKFALLAVGWSYAALGLASRLFRR